MWTVGCQLGWAIFHKSNMWAILGLGGGGSLSHHQSVGNLGKNGGIRAARITRECGRPREKQWVRASFHILGVRATSEQQWVGSAFHIPRVWIASEKNTLDGQIGGVRATFHILGCGKPRTFIGYWTFSYPGHGTLDVPLGSPKGKREGVAVYCNLAGDGDCLGCVNEEGW